MRYWIHIAALFAMLAVGCRTPSVHREALQAPPGDAAQHFITWREPDREKSVSEKATRFEPLPDSLDNSQPVQLASLQQVDESLPPALPLVEPSIIESGDSESSALSLTDLEAIALQNNPAVSEAAARVSAARGQWLQVGLPPNPIIGYSGQQLGSGGAAEQNGGFIGQEFVRGNKLGLNRNVACWEIQQAEQEFAVARQRVATDVQLAYFAVLIAQQRRQLANELLQIGLRGQKAVDDLFRIKDVSEADPLRAAVEVETARIFVQTAANQHSEAWRRLAAVLGVPGMPIQPVAGQLEIESMPLVWRETLETILLTSPEISAASAEIEAKRWAIQRACAEAIPNVELQAVIQDDRSTGSVNSNIQITFPLPLWNRNQGGVQRANGEAIAAERKYERIALDLQRRLADAFQRYETARNQVEQYSRKDGILDKTKRSLTLIRKGYEADELDILDLLNAQRRYFETRLTFLDAQQQYWFANTEIQGLLLSGSLN